MINYNEVELSLCVRHFLVHSYIYYVLDKTIITDQSYDLICVRLGQDVKETNKIIKQIHPKLYKKYKKEFKDFKTGSGHFIKEEDYPGIVKSVALNIINHDIGKS